jgi:hypothetical protein
MKRPWVVWQMDLEDQSLLIKSISAIIGILESTTFKIPILSDEVVVAHAEHKPLIIITDQAIHGNDSNTLPLLVQKARFPPLWKPNRFSCELILSLMKEQYVAGVMATFKALAFVAMEQLAQS